MKRNRPTTPFPTTGYYGEEFFCNREEETSMLINNVNGGQSTTLVALRRIGKTGLVKHVQNKLEKELICIYADILPTENSSDLLNALATAIVNAVPERTSIGKKIWSFIKTLRPVINYDALSGQPNISFNIHPNDSAYHIESLFTFLEKQEKRVLFAIDEFQQIVNYPEKNIEAWLRKTIQQLKNVVFIFSGSQQHLMNDIFSNPSKPFYRSTLFLQLKKIPFNEYQDFIQEKFSDSRKEISKEIVAEILNWTDVYTYFVQLLCNRVYLSSKKKISSVGWRQEAYKILKEQEYIFFEYRDLLTSQQWNLLKAIAREGKVKAPTSKEFLIESGIGSPATVRRSLDSLLKKEMIYKDYDHDGKTFYCVYDVLFQRWIQAN